MLRSLIRILCASLVQIDTEMAKKYAKRYPQQHQRYAISSHSDSVGIPTGFSVGMGWVWALTFNPHGSPVYHTV